MKTIEDRAREYASKCSGIQSTAWGFIAGAESEHAELLRWHDPKEELPEDGVFVLLKTGIYPFTVAKHVTDGWFEPGDYECGLPDEDVLGWREIHE